MTLNPRNWIVALASLAIVLVSGQFVIAGKDAPPPKAPPKDWRKYVFEDIKAPAPRPKPAAMSQPMGLQGSTAPMAKDAPKPKDPPKDWRKYVFEDIKAPTPRPKPSALDVPFDLNGSASPMAKDAPKPKDPPKDWRKYVFEDIKAPTPRPKSTVPLDPFKAIKRPDRIGFPPPQQSSPSMGKYPPKNPPYTHPPRDLKGPKGPNGPIR